MPVPDAAREAFDAMTTRLGLSLPADRVESIYQGYTVLLGMTADLRQPRTAASEPAGIFVPSTVVREAAP